MNRKHWTEDIFVRCPLCGFGFGVKQSAKWTGMEEKLYRKAMEVSNVVVKKGRIDRSTLSKKMMCTGLPNGMTITTTLLLENPLTISTTLLSLEKEVLQRRVFNSSVEARKFHEELVERWTR